MVVDGLFAWVRLIPGVMNRLSYVRYLRRNVGIETIFSFVREVSSGCTTAVIWYTIFVVEN